MAKIKNYILLNFSRSFFTIFLPFFLIFSLIYLVKIAGLTSKIQITFFELFQLYTYSIPDIIFYTIPISFIAALSNLLIKLSQDNELIALYALGYNANKVIQKLFVLALLFSLLLASISFLAMPLSKQLYKSFKQEKKSEAKLNIVAGELGQKFGEYYIYIQEKDGDLFHNMVIYNRSDRDNEQFFAAKTGKIRHQGKVTSLLLNDGYGYTYSDIKLQQAQYDTLEVFDKVNTKSYKFEDIIAHWAKASDDIKMMHRVLFFVFVSFMPLLALYLIASFAMINPRYQKNRSFLIIFATTFFLYGIASSLEKWGTPSILLLSIISTFIMGLYLFKQRVKRYF
jgi:lipopolysaccharide export system permease protein